MIRAMVLRRLSKTERRGARPIALPVESFLLCVVVRGALKARGVCVCA